MKSIKIISLLLGTLNGQELSCYSCQGSTLDEVTTGCELSVCPPVDKACISMKFSTNGTTVYQRGCFSDVDALGELKGCQCVGVDSYVCADACDESECDSIGDGFQTLDCSVPDTTTISSTTTTTATTTTEMDESGSFQPLVSILALLIALN